MEEALAQKGALLHEVDHRVKNNLQLISSLMQMQARRTSEPTVRAALEGMLQRLHAIGAVHRRLVPGFVRELSELTEGIDAQGLVPLLRRYLWSDHLELMRR